MKSGKMPLAEKGLLYRVKLPKIKVLQPTAYDPMERGAKNKFVSLILQTLPY